MSWRIQRWGVLEAAAEMGHLLFSASLPPFQALLLCTPQGSLHLDPLSEAPARWSDLQLHPHPDVTLQGPECLNTSVTLMCWGRGLQILGLL